MSDTDDTRNPNTVPSGCWSRSLALLLFLGAFYFLTLVLVPNAP